VVELVDLPAGRQARRDSMIYTVYVLSSTTKNYLYVGLTHDLDHRIFRHNAGREKTTRSYRPFRLIHKETFRDRPSARIREKYLKSGTGKEFLKGSLKQ